MSFATPERHELTPEQIRNAQLETANSTLATSKSYEKEATWHPEGSDEQKRLQHYSNGYRNSARALFELLGVNIPD